MSSKILKATAFATQAHGKQMRKSTGLPYIIHPLRVALILQDTCAVKDEEVIIAAILHDVIEDTSSSVKNITERFDERVASMVLEVTDDKSLSIVERKRAQIAHAKIMTKGALLIKIADKIDNVRGFVWEGTPEGWGESRVRGYAAWSLAVARSGLSRYMITSDAPDELRLAIVELERNVAPYIGKEALENQNVLDSMVEAYFKELDKKE